MGRNDEWERALRTLVQTNRGRPLADLLRNVMPTDQRGVGEIPISVIYDLAELLDPLVPWNPYADTRNKESAVRLRIAPLPKRERDPLNRNQKVWGAMSAAIHKGCSVEDAAAEVAETVKLSQRHVMSIWARGRQSQPMLAAVKARRQRNPTIAT